MTTLITASYGDAISVNFTSDAWFNATTACKPFCKEPFDWLKTDDTKSYIKAITKIFGIEENQLFRTKRGSPENGGGTWFHPKLAIPFARWLNPEFGVWCDMQIEKILHSEPAAIQPAKIKPGTPLPGCLPYYDPADTDRQKPLARMYVEYEILTGKTYAFGLLDKHLLDTEEGFVDHMMMKNPDRLLGLIGNYLANGTARDDRR